MNKSRLKGVVRHKCYIYISIYIYIYMGCNGSQNSWFGSIQHSGVTVQYVFDGGGGAIGYVAMLEIFLL